MTGKSFLIDTTRCTACRGCQIACKQWKRLPATRTRNWGSHQNPPDLSFATFKLLHFSEVVRKGKIRWYFFAEQCRHCLEPSCKEMAESLGYKNAIVVDDATGAVIFRPEVKIEQEDFEDIRDACPYNIPRYNKKTRQMAKCDMCIDRVKAGLLPACVKTCPTGATSFGNRNEILRVARKRLEDIKRTYPEAQLLDMKEVRTIYLIVDKPESYCEYASASERGKGISRRLVFRRLLRHAQGRLNHLL